MTNGEMIKTMFPHGKYTIAGNKVYVDGIGGHGRITFMLEWWNEPHEVECGDVISRQEAFMCLTADITDMTIEDYISMVSKRIKDLSPVTLRQSWLLVSKKLFYAVTPLLAPPIAQEE